MSTVIDASTRERLLRRIGLHGVPTADETGLREVHRAFVSQVPYEDLAVQLGEFAPLDAQRAGGARPKRWARRILL